MDWIVLGIVGWVLGFLFVLILMRIAGDGDRAARHAQRDIDPASRGHHHVFRRRRWVVSLRQTP